MERNMMIGIGVAVVVLIVVVFSMSGGDSDVSSSGSGSGSGGISAYSGDSDFVEFGAELVCVRDDYAKGLKNKGDANVARAEYAAATEALMERYGYSEDDANAYAEKFVEDLDYARAVIARVKVLCSSAAAELESNIIIAEDGMYVKITINEANDHSDIEYKYFSDGYINQGSNSGTADLDNIRAVLVDTMGEELADEAMDVAVIEYE